MSDERKEQDETPKTSDEIRAMISGLDAEPAAEPPKKPEGEAAGEHGAPPEKPGDDGVVKPVKEEAAAPAEGEEIPAEVATDPKARAKWAYDLRKREREAAERAAALERELKEIKDGKQPGREATPPERRPAADTAQENEQVFTILANALKAERGEIVPGIRDAAQARELRQLAKQVIETMAPDDVLAVLQKAESGAFGDASADVREAAQAELTVALAKSKAVETRQSQEERAAAQFQEAVDAQVRDVYTRHPALKPPEAGKEGTPEFKFALQWFKDNVGTEDKPGLFYGLPQRDPANIGKLFDRCMRDYELQQLRAMRAERDTYKSTLDRIRGGQPSGGPAGGGDTPAGSAALKAELEKRVGPLDAP